MNRIKRRKLMLQKSILILFSLALIFSPFSSLGELAYAEDVEEAQQNETVGETDQENESDDPEESNEVQEGVTVDGEDEVEPSIEDSGESSEGATSDTDTDTGIEGEVDSDSASLEEEIDNQTPSIEPFSLGDPQVLGGVQGDYELEDHGDGTATITGYTGDDTELIIPNEINGFSIVEIGKEAFQSKSLISVTIPEHVKNIGDYAFRNNNIASVTIPDHVQKIGSHAFSSNNITSVTISDSVKEIGSYAFSNNQITSITIPPNVENLGVSPFGANGLETIIVDIGNGSYKDINKKGLYTKNGETIIQATKSAEIDEEVKNIGSYAFASLNLTEFDLPESVEVIESFAFRYNNLITINIPESVLEINSLAFEGNRLTDVYIHNPQTELNGGFIRSFGTNADPEDLTIHGYASSTADQYAEAKQHIFKAFGEDDYEWVDNDDGVTITGYTGTDKNLWIPRRIEGKDVTVIGEEAFKEKDLTHVEIPNTVRRIEKLAFFNNKLESIDFPDNLTEIGQQAFRYNDLENINIPNSVTEIGLTAFAENSLTNVVISENLTVIENSVFADNSLVSVEIPEGVTKINNHAFNGNNLERVDLPDSLTEIEFWAFANNQLESIEIPEGVSKIGRGSLGNVFTNNQLTDVFIYNKNIELAIDIFENNQQDSTDLTIHGYSTSTAETYAADNGYTFSAFINIPDDALRKAIKDELGEDESYLLTKQDLESLEELNATNKGIEDLTGLEHATNLEWLNFYDNNIADISILENLTNLVWLDLGYNNIADISALENLANLEELYLDDNNIANISALENLTNLEELNLTDNNITDISVLENLTGLDWLYLSNNRISDISPLESNILNLSSLWLDNQSIELPELELLVTSSTLEIDNPIINIDGAIFEEITVKDGLYSSPKIKWTGLTGTETGRTFTFDDGEQNGFSGTVTQPIKWIANKDNLETEIDRANGLDEADYTADSFAALRAALAEAETVFTDPNATQAEVDDVLTDLEAAITNLEDAPVVVEDFIIELGQQREVAAGETYEIKNTNSTITMPSDLPAGTLLLIENYDKDKINEEGLRVAGDSFTFTFIFPEGEDLPKEDYILTMGYDNDVNEDNIGIYYLNETASIWEGRGGDVDESNQTITLSVPHFSTYAVLEKIIEGEEDNGELSETPGDDEQGDPKDEGKPGKDSDDKQVDPKNGEKVTISDEDKSDALPSTATSIFNMLALGLGLLAIGAVIIVLTRRKRSA